MKNEVVRKTGYHELVKKLTLLRLMILVILSKKLTMTQKLVKLKKKTNRYHSNKHITA